MGETLCEDILCVRQRLVVSFIISITAVNVLLIFVITRKKQFIYKPKWLILISLAIGDILLAFYPLVVLARFYFESDPYSHKCSITYPAEVYIYFLIHFVYGVGLIVLAIELVVRYKRQPAHPHDWKAMVMALLYSAVPWIIGLLVVLPLTMAGMDWERCFLENWTPSRERAMNIVSVILPACAAVIACFIIMFIKLQPYREDDQGQEEMISTPADSASLPVPHYPMHHLSEYAMGANTADQNNSEINIPTASASDYLPRELPPNPIQPQQNNDCTNVVQELQSQENDLRTTRDNPPLVTDMSANTDPSLEMNPVVSASSNNTNPNNSEPNIPRVLPYFYAPNPIQPEQCNEYTYAGQGLQSSENDVPTTLDNLPLVVTEASAFAYPKREKISLMLVSVVYFCCVIPLAAFILTPRTSDDKVLYEIFYWLSIYRSLITPAIWIAFSARHFIPVIPNHIET